MELRTHKEIDRRFNGRVTELGEGFARVWLETLHAMVADEKGLIHGGFLFSAADYAAMAAVNDPHVVLGAAELKFLAPVKKGESVRFDARVVGKKSKKRTVHVMGTVNDKPVFEGDFTAFVLPRHVLES
ncbi:hotdog domain-containing protein [Nitratifractor sp.]